LKLNPLAGDFSWIAGDDFKLKAKPEPDPMQN
jgi:hypothetical protein